MSSVKDGARRPDGSVDLVDKLTKWKKNTISNPFLSEAKDEPSLSAVSHIKPFLCAAQEMEY